jgi:hypothetical protein
LQILIRELGYGDAMRFMLQFGTGRPGGDYTRERHEFLPDWTPQQFIDESERLIRKAGPGAAP